MAYGSWQGLYNAVIEELMADEKEQELLLLMAIARHADFLGFCRPGKARLMKMRHIGETLYNQRLAFLEKRCMVRFELVYDHYSRGYTPLFQVSPRVLYVRSEFQDYLERVFDGEERNISLEMWWTQNNSGQSQNNSSLRDSQPEQKPDAVTRRSNQTQEPHTRTRQENQLATTQGQEERKASTMRNGEQRVAQTTAQSATDRDSAQKDQPPGGVADEFGQLFHVDDDRLAQEIKHVVSTTDHQARAAVEAYPRDAIIHWLRMTAIRRQRRELSNPAGWFFNMLRTQTKPLDPAMPNGQTYQDFVIDNPGYSEEL